MTKRIEVVIARAASPSALTEVEARRAASATLKHIERSYKYGLYGRGKKRKATHGVLEVKPNLKPRLGGGRGQGEND